MGVKLGLKHSGKNTDRIFENRLLKKIFGPKRQEVMKTGENCIIQDNMSFLICQIPFR
jgi:hypothetical protein